MMERRRILFHRTWHGPGGGRTGGQLKVRDAFEHFLSDPTLDPQVWFPPDTVWTDDPGNHWLKYRHAGIPHWEIKASDVLFFSGMDWLVLSETQRKDPPVPVMAIAQPRHTRDEDKRKPFLEYPAVRIAKSKVGKDMLERAKANGPVVCIPDAIDLEGLPEPRENPQYDVLIIGLKNQPLAERLFQKLQRHFRWNLRKPRMALQVPPALPTRADFLNLLNDCRIAVFLPLDAERGAEGFYMPALEAMALRKLVVCPYAVGNSDFCIPGETCLQPAYDLESLFLATLGALNMPTDLADRVRQAAWETSTRHSLAQERQAYLELIHHIDDLWADKDLFRKDH